MKSKLPLTSKTPHSLLSFRFYFTTVRTAFVSTSTIVLLTCPALAIGKDVDWDSLNLSPQQETQIDRLEDSWEKTHSEVSSQVERDMTQLRSILPTGNTQQIRELQSRISSNKMYLMNQSMDTFLKKRDTLTPNQRAQLQKMIPAKYHHQ